MPLQGVLYVTLGTQGDALGYGLTAPSVRASCYIGHPGRCLGLWAYCPFRACFMSHWAPRAMPWAMGLLPLLGVLHDTLGTQGDALGYGLTAPSGRASCHIGHLGRCPGLWAYCPFGACFMSHWAPKAMPWAMDLLPLQGVLHDTLGTQGDALGYGLTAPLGRAS